MQFHRLLCITLLSFTLLGKPLFSNEAKPDQTGEAQPTQAQVEPPKPIAPLEESKPNELSDTPVPSKETSPPPEMADEKVDPLRTEPTVKPPEEEEPSDPPAEERPAKKGEAPDTETKFSRFEGAIIAGGNLVSFAIAPGGTSRNRLSLMGGIRGTYHFSQTIGLFLGSEFVTRGAKLNSGANAVASFLDFPFGVRLQGPVLFGENGKLAFHLGGYLSLPLGDLKVGETVVQKTRFSLGIYTQAQTTFFQSDVLSLALALWLKGGVLDSYQNSSLGYLQKIIEFGIGLVLQF